MVAVASSGSAVPKGWFAGLFAAPPAVPPLRIARTAAAAAEFLTAIEAAAARLAPEGMEDRARAATSGFEMGEYEPIARRN